MLTSSLTITLHLQFISTPSPHSSLPKKLKKSKNRNKNNHNQHKIHKNHPLPTPLLQNNKPHYQTLTRLQALEAVVRDLEEANLKYGVKVDTQTFCSVLETCYKLNAIDHGIRVHKLIPERILFKNVGVASKLVRLYAANGRVEDAHQLFDEMLERNESAFVWNSLVSGYAEVGKYEDALAMYFQMVEEGVEPDRYTFPRALRACSGIGLIHVGEEIHRHVVRYGFWDDGFVLNSLVDMYAKCGDIVKARRVFDHIGCKDMVSWNSMIRGYIHHGLLGKAIKVLRDMLRAQFEPDEITISSTLTRVDSVKLGGQIHGWVIRHGLEWNLPITNSLMSFYSCNGYSNQTRWLFSNMPVKDIVSWNSIISAHQKDSRALSYFQEMEEVGTMPDAITFVGLLSACAHLGLVKEGESFFSVMKKEYGIRPIMEHYACMVNLYGRAGLIAEAYELIMRKMEFEAGSTVWGALLYACSLHANAEVGEVAAFKLFELEPDNGHNFKLLMRIYQSLDRFDDVVRVRKMMVDRGLE